jgi:hypothetical protein
MAADLFHSVDDTGPHGHYGASALADLWSRHPIRSRVCFDVTWSGYAELKRVCLSCVDWERGMVLVNEYPGETPEGSVTVVTNVAKKILLNKMP